MNILAIDPGKKGGWAYRDELGRITFGIMPISGNILDVTGLAILAKQDFLTKVYIEKVHSMPGQSCVAMFNFGMGFGQLIGMCQSNLISYVLVTPQAWKKEILHDTLKDKASAIEFCRREYPGLDLIPKGCRKPHDGIADALCILTYAIRKGFK